MFRTRLATDRVRSTRSRPSYFARLVPFVSCCSRSAFFSRVPIDDFDISLVIGFFESSDAESFSTSAACSRVMWLTESPICDLN